jgi:hypothetical protein
MRLDVFFNGDALKKRRRGVASGEIIPPRVCIFSLCSYYIRISHEILTRFFVFPVSVLWGELPCSGAIKSTMSQVHNRVFFSKLW